MQLMRAVGRLCSIILATYADKTMLAFLCSATPHSVNSKNKTAKAAYYAKLVAAFQRYHPSAVPITSNLYGFVCYFYKSKTQFDADNLSKPVWDALVNTAYQDDSIVRLRTSGLIDQDSNEIDAIDVTHMPDTVLDDFLDMLDDESHIIYVEMGPLDYGFFRFGGK